VLSPLSIADTRLGVDLTAFLAGGSVVLAGDIPSTLYSIGGADSRTNSLGVVGGALGTETGLFSA